MSPAKELIWQSTILDDEGGNCVPIQGPTFDTAIAVVDDGPMLAGPGLSITLWFDLERYYQGSHFVDLTLEFVVVVYTCFCDRDRLRCSNSMRHRLRNVISRRL